MTFIQISDRLSYGGQNTCARQHSNAAIIHACKEPCHRCAVGYSAKTLDQTHPHYLSCVRGNQLYLNLIDPPLPLFQLESFHALFQFVDSLPDETPLHIHCNQGRSRAPSLALLLMAKRLNLLPAGNYAAAAAAFSAKYPYQPGKGIARYLEDNWDRLDPAP